MLVDQDDGSGKGEVSGMSIEFTQAQPGIYEFSNGSIAILGPNLILVAWGTEPMSIADMDRAVEYLKERFSPDMKVIVFSGPLKYTSLAESKDLRALILDLIREVMPS